MVLIDITRAEKKRFKTLQEQGMLPSQALKKLESERRLGIVPKDEKFYEKEDWWFYPVLGTIGIAVLAVIIRSKTSQSIPLYKSESLYNIEGIDLNALNICKEKRLM